MALMYYERALACFKWLEYRPKEEVQETIEESKNNLENFEESEFKGLNAEEL